MLLYYYCMGTYSIHSWFLSITFYRLPLIRLTASSLELVTFGSSLLLFYFCSKAGQVHQFLQETYTLWTDPSGAWREQRAHGLAIAIYPYGGF